MRTLVLGGAGNFGARILRALRGDPAFDLLSAGRRADAVPGAEEIPRVALDIGAPDLAERLASLAPALVVHCVGPFQRQDYRVAVAALSAGADYVDLADGRAFVVGFAEPLDARAQAAGRVAITGASTLPALSSAVVDALCGGLSGIEAIDVVIAPGQRAPRGRATLEAVFGYLGAPFPVWRDRSWRRTWGWMDLRNVSLAIGSRLAAACDVPDLALFPQRYAPVRDVRFHAALEFRLQHLALWTLAALRRVGLPLPAARIAMALDRLAWMFDPFAGDRGGMAVAVTGRRADGARVRRSWQADAPAVDGPEIPCFAAILLARRIASGDRPAPGAYPCMGQLALSEFAPLFAQWRIDTRVDESPA